MTRQVPDPTHATSWNRDAFDLLLNKLRSEMAGEEPGKVKRLLNSLSGGIVQASEEHSMEDYRRYKHAHLQIRSAWARVS